MEAIIHNNFLLMVRVDYDKRIKSFNEINRSLLNLVTEDKFGFFDKIQYRAFADELIETLAQIEIDTKYRTDVYQILRLLEEVHLNSVLEEYIQNLPALLKCFLIGPLKYKKMLIRVQQLKILSYY